MTVRLGYMARYFQDEALSGLRPGYEWLVDNRPAERESPAVCHGDFHPSNIMVNNGEVTGVIDWPGAAFADPELDVATTLVLIKVAAGQVEPQARPILEPFANQYLEAYRGLARLDLEKVRYYEAMRCFRAFTRGSAVHTPGIDPALQPRDQYPWGGDYAMRALRARLQEITGVELPLPSGL